MSELIHLKGLLFIMASLVRADYHDIAALLSLVGRVRGAAATQRSRSRGSAQAVTFCGNGISIDFAKTCHRPKPRSQGMLISNSGHFLH